MTENNQCESNVKKVKIDVDVSDALVGLKGLQRQTRKTIDVLKELEKQSNVSVVDEEC